MTDRDEICIRVLARSDACRLPCRDFRGDWSANRWTWQNWLRADGIPLPSNERSVDARKRFERQVTAAAQPGILTVRANRGERAIRAKLTPAGELHYRALCGLPGLAEAVGMLAAIAERSRPDATTLDHVWVDEIALNDGRGWGDGNQAELQALEDVFFVLDTLGLAACGSTSQGHVRYALTASGWALPADMEALHKLKLPALDKHAQDAYQGHLNEAVQALRYGPAIDPREIGELPLVLGHVGTPVNKCFAPG